MKDSLLEEQYSTQEILYVENFILDLFDKAASVVFGEVLEKPLPESIEINLLRDKEPVYDIWRQNFEIARFDAESSRSGNFVFVVREFMFRSIIDEEDNGYFIVTALQEMTRAADLPVWDKGMTLLSGIERDSRNLVVAFGEVRHNPFKVLHRLVQLLWHCRSEGIASLGGYLLSKRGAGLSQRGMQWFSDHIVSVCEKLQWWIKGDWPDDGFLDNEILAANEVAVGVLLFVMLRCGDLDKEEMAKLAECFTSGNYDFTIEEQHSILRRALSLTMLDYLKGLFVPDEEARSIVPKKAFFDTVALWRETFGEKQDGFLLAIEASACAKELDDALNGLL